MKTGIYWDYQNIQLTSRKASTLLVDKILDFAREKGEIGTLRAYANWSSPTIKAETAQNLTSAGFELIHVPLTRKNSVDLVISTDLGKAAMETSIQTYVLITSDGDFIPALASLRRAGKYTVVIANPDVANERLQLAADDFLPLNRFQSQPELVPVSAVVELGILGDPDTEIMKKLSTSTDENLGKALSLLKRAVIECSNEGRNLQFSSIATKMYEIEPRFDYKKIASLPYKKFQALATEAVKQGYVNLRTVEGWQELYVPEKSAEDVPQELLSESSSRNLTAFETEFIRKCLINLIELEHNRTSTFIYLHNYMRKQDETNELTLSNSELKQLLLGMIDAEIFRRVRYSDPPRYRISPLWQELWKTFSVEYRL